MILARTFRTWSRVVLTQTRDQCGMRFLNKSNRQSEKLFDRIEIDADQLSACEMGCAVARSEVAPPLLFVPIPGVCKSIVTSGNFSSLCEILPISWNRSHQ